MSNGKSIALLLIAVVPTIWSSQVLAERSCGESLYTLDCFKAYGTDLLPTHKARLDHIADNLQKRRMEKLDYYPPDLVIVIGHSAIYNQSDTVEEKALKRAQNTVDYLRQALENRYIGDIRLVVAGAGVREPVTTNASVQGRNINRRVEIFIRSERTFRNTLSQIKDYADDEFASSRVVKFRQPSCHSDAEADKMCNRRVDLKPQEKIVGSVCLPSAIRCVVGRSKQP